LSSQRLIFKIIVDSFIIYLCSTQVPLPTGTLLTARPLLQKINISIY